METYVEVLEKVLSLKGLEVLRSSRLLIACLNDVGGIAWKRETTLMARNFDDELLQLFYAAAIDDHSSFWSVRNRVITILENEMGLTRNVATELSNELAVAVDSYTGRNELSGINLDKNAAERDQQDEFLEQSAPSDNDQETDFEAPVRIIRGIINAVKIASSFDNPRLQGVLLSFKNNVLTAAATDSYRLAVAECSCASLAKPFTLIIPKEIAQWIGDKITDKLDRYPSGSVQLTTRGRILRVCYNGRTATGTMLTGGFPNIHKLLEFNNSSCECRVNRDGFISAVYAVGNGQSSEATAVQLRINSAMGRIGIQHNGFEESIPCGTNGHGVDIEIALNYRYLMDGLEAVDDDELTIVVTEHNKPIMIRAEESFSYRYLLMPIASN